MKDVYDEQGKIRPDVFGVLKLILAVAPDTDKAYALRYIHANNRYYEIKEEACQYPVSTTFCDQESVAEEMMELEGGEGEGKEEEGEGGREGGGLEDRVIKVFYPPFDEQMKRAHTVVKYARRYGLLQCNDAVVNLAAMIRYFEKQDAWSWNHASCFSK